MRFRLVLLAGAMMWLTACRREAAPVQRTLRQLLVYSPTSAWQTEQGQRLARWLAQLPLDAVVVTHSRDSLSEAVLPRYSALLLYRTDEDSFQIWHHADLERYVAAGNGVVAIDADSVTPYLWPWYDSLVSHRLSANDARPGPFVAFEYGGGRAVRCLPEVLAQADSAEWHLAQAIEYAIGPNSYNYASVRQPRAPHFNRFTKVVLDNDIYEPMEMVVLPDMKVLFLERRGKMKLYDPYRKRTTVVAEFDVCIEGNYEDGLHGIALDPGYGKDNWWIYVYYSPSSSCDVPEQYLSRFVFRDDSLHWHTEKVMLKVPVQRETCCHSGGSVEFGPDGLLYLSTGDNTSSKESDGYSPLDERPGRAPFDAQKSSSNTNDLRGKILRIKPEPDGTYSIPEGNLFPPGTPGTRPEIYAMGCRNPFRITIDRKTGWLYWGDVGPDAGVDHPRYGPQSYDEWNQAKGPGNFGWPYFEADNKAFPMRDFATDEVGPPQDPQHPVNESPNNTGLRALPPAQPAWIWYPYSPSKEFPLLGQGSRSAMAGPFYYSDRVIPTSTVKFPEYYEGKFFIFEWARSWIKVLTLDEEGRLLKMEPFCPDMPISKPIELEFGPDGVLYVLEYGRQYFMNNPDAMLSRIEFAAGNRAPVPKVWISHTHGAAPLEVVVDASASFDHDAGDTLGFSWFLDDAQQAASHAVRDTFAFAQAGYHTIRLSVQDPHGAAAWHDLTVAVGNEPPQVRLVYDANRSFYFGREGGTYRVEVRDPEDEAAGGIARDRIVVQQSWVSDPEFLNRLRQGKEALPEGPLAWIEGLRLIRESDCFTCHEMEAENIGPSFREIAHFYRAQAEEVTPALAQKVIKGGNGVWGEKLMAAHPQLSPEEAKLMVRYILSLEGAGTLPPQGRFTFDAHQPGDQGGYVLSAAYRDSGAHGIEPLSGRDVLVLRSPAIEAEWCDAHHKGLESRFGRNQEFTQVGLRAGGWLRFDQMDLAGIHTLRIRLRAVNGGPVELHLDSPEGTVVGRATAAPTKDWTWIAIPLTGKPAGLHDLYLVFGGSPNTWTDASGRTQEWDAWAVDKLEFTR